MNVEDLLQLQFLGNSLLSWLYASLAFFLTAVGARLLLSSLIRRLSVFAERTQTKLDDIAVTLIDVDSAPEPAAVERIAAIHGVLSVRCLGC